MLPKRLTWIDETYRQEYHFLQADDRCLFYGDFHSGQGWSGGATNQLISNFKKKPSEIARSLNASKLQYYKDKAIAEVADALRATIDATWVNQHLTFVPIPGSKLAGDPDYCDRLERALRMAFVGHPGLDIRPLLRQTRSTAADHRSGGSRIPFDELLDITVIDYAQLTSPVRGELILFDDVLTSGKHFRVAFHRIREQLPAQVITGLFVARAIHRNPFAQS